MSQPPWTPPPGDDPDDEGSYRGAHSSGDADESGAPAPDAVPGSSPTPGPWSGVAAQPWAQFTSADPWAEARASWGSEPAPPATPDPVSTNPPSGPADAPVDPVPAPWPVPPSGAAGYGPPSYGHPDGPAAGPALGEPSYAPRGYDTQGQPQQAPPPPERPQQPAPPAAPLGRTGGEQDTGGPFRTVRHDAVPPGPSVYVPADAPPTPRPPQPQLPDSMSDVPQYAARLAPAPLPDPGPPADLGPGAWPGEHPTVTPPPGVEGQNAVYPGEPGQAPGQQPGLAPAQQPPQEWSGSAAQWPVDADSGTPAPPPVPRPEDLLVPSRPLTLEKPATWGWRGRLSRATGGLYKPRASEAELADRKARITVQRGFSRPMTVVVIQPKGGAGKTPTTICVSSALGVRRGGYVVGWDNNETRGTLAVRTTNDDDQRTTAWDLLGRLDGFEGSGARVGDLSYYTRAQGEAQFDALVSDDNPGNMAQIGEVEFKRIHQVLQRFYRMIIIDTGNNVRSSNWQAAVDHADQIVVVSTYQRDVGYSGSWVLEHLTQTGRGELARDAITVLTAAEPAPDDQVRAELVKHFGARTRAVVEVPYDPHIAEGGPIRWHDLTVASQRAWTGVAAAITQTLYDRDQRQLTDTGRSGH